jgi:hypothetical protein
LIESFDKLNLQLNVDLWFTENDFKSRVNSTSSPSATRTSSTSTTVTNDQVFNLTNSNNSISSNNNNNNNEGGTPSELNTIANNNGMQLLCSRLFKIHFDPRQGIHLQIPVVFDYFHLSALLLTVHCALQTLLPPVFG